jgi:hypothetical protein
VISIYVSLEPALSFELGMVAAELAKVWVCFYMKALNVSHQVLLVIEKLVAHAAGPALHAATSVHRRHALVFDISCDIALLHEN